MNINTMDLNLLKVFAAIYEHRNVSKAANSIGLAQSSMSNALARLRDQLDDPLFQRATGGVIPTVRADELAPGIRSILSSLTDLLEPVTFNPNEVKADVTIAASDNLITRFAPALVKTLSDQAPGLTLHFEILNKQTHFSSLDANVCQILVGTFTTIPARFYRKALTQEHFVCIARQGHALTQQPLCLKRYAESTHILMTLNKDKVGAVDKTLKALGYERKIAMTCAQFSPLIEVVANSDYIATIPSSLAASAQRMGCDVFPLPFDMPVWETQVVMTPKYYTSELGRYLMSVLQSQFG